MQEQFTYTLINPQNGNLAFKIATFTDATNFDHIQRHNYYSLIWITGGSGKVKADFREHVFASNCLFAFSPYQPFMLVSKALYGVALYFHPDFFCIHKHQGEIACNGVLFNNIYDPPFIRIDENDSGPLQRLLDQMKAEMQNPGLAQNEFLVSCLKIFLINCSRIKAELDSITIQKAPVVRSHFVLQELRSAIEMNYRKKHSPGDYASQLNMSIKTLGKVTKLHYNKTITQLISDRIIIEAKRELYLTNKSIKQIADELGYDDEYYFSRFFKTNTDISPKMYRNTVGVGRGAA